MTDGPALLRAVVDNPAENAPRLIYADWLDEHGEADRAEFIRGQIRLSEMDPWDDGFAPLESRCRQLERAHPEWLAGLEEFVSRSERFCGQREEPFERGFLTRIKQTPAQFAKNGPLFEAHPITRVEFRLRVWSQARGWEPQTDPTWFDHPALAHLMGVDFAGLDGETRLPEVLKCLERVPPLDHFGLIGGGRDGSDMRAALAAPAVGGVRSLAIMGTGLTRETESALVSAAWPNLRRLTRVWIQDADWLRAPWIRQLHELTVSDTEPNLDLAQRSVVAEVLPETAIRALRLGRWVLDGAGARALGLALGRSQVRSLAVGQTNTSLVAVGELLTPEVLARLRALYLSWAELDADIVGRLAGTGLRVCALRHMTADALSALTQAPGLPDLAELRLDLVWTGPNDRVADRLRDVLEAGTLPALVHLMLSNTPQTRGLKVRHGDEIAGAVANCPGAAGLRTLYLGEAVTRVGAAALAGSKHLSGLQVLNVPVWPKDADAERMLADRFGNRVHLDTVGIEF
jgi:uncharacterized protein (TIGR02996 family)